MDPFQLAHREGHSTETAPVRVHNDIVSAVDQGHGVCLILLDLSTAFDTVDHTILCTFLDDFIGLEGPALGFFKSYLTGRTQCVSVKRVTSELSELMFGVPQGSVLGPLIFCIYTLPLSANLKHYKIGYHIYVDDTQLYCTFEVDSLDDVLTSLRSCISDIRSWMIKNKLKINDDKTEFLLVTSPLFQIHKRYSHFHRPTQYCSIFLMQEPWGYWWALKYGYPDQRYMPLNSFPYQKHWCHSRFPSYSCGSSTCSFSCHVTPRLDYCNALLLGIPAYKIQRPQRMHNIAARVVVRPDHDHDSKSRCSSWSWPWQWWSLGISSLASS